MTSGTENLLQIQIYQCPLFLKFKMPCVSDTLWRTYLVMYGCYYVVMCGYMRPVHKHCGQLWLNVTEHWILYQHWQRNGVKVDWPALTNTRSAQQGQQGRQYRSSRFDLCIPTSYKLFVQNKKLCVLSCTPVLHKNSSRVKRERVQTPAFRGFEVNSVKLDPGSS